VLLQNIEEAGQQFLNNAPDHEVASLLGPVSDVSDAEVPARGCESSDCAVNAAHGSTSTPLTCGARDR